MAKSSAISSPSAEASAHRASKSATVPRSGCTASWPPSRGPIAQGLPGSSGPATGALLRPLRCGLPDGVDRRSGRPRRTRARPAAAAPGAPRRSRRRSAGRARTRRRRPRARGRRRPPGAVGRRQRRRGRVAASRAPASAGSRASAMRSACGRPSSMAVSVRSTVPSGSPLSPGEGALEERPALGQLAREVLLAGGHLALQLVAPGGEPVDPGLDDELVPAQPLEGQLGAPAVGVARGDHLQRAHRPRRAGGGGPRRAGARGRRARSPRGARPSRPACA